MPMSSPSHSGGRTDLPGGVIYYAPDSSHRAEVLARLQRLGAVQWQDSAQVSPTQLARQASGYRLILLDFEDTLAPVSAQLAPVLRELLPSMPMLALGSIYGQQGAGVLSAWRAGLHDFIELTASDEDIRLALQKALAPAPAPLRVAPAPQLAQGRLVLLLGVRPGVGCSTLASHLAALAGEGTPADGAQPAHLLLDLGYPQGDGALYLGIDHDFHYEHALQQANRIDTTLVRTAFAHHGAKLAVLSRPYLTQRDGSPLGEPEALLRRLREVFGSTLCDLGGLTLEQIPVSLWKAADAIWLMTDQSIGAVLSLDSWLRQIDQHGLRDGRLKLLVNRDDAEAGLSAEQLAQRFRLPLLAGLPERSRALRAAANQGHLLHELAPRDPYIRALAPLLGELDRRPQPTGGAPTWQQRLQRLGGRPWKRT